MNPENNQNRPQQQPSQPQQAPVNEPEVNAEIPQQPQEQQPAQPDPNVAPGEQPVPVPDGQSNVIIPESVESQPAGSTNEASQTNTPVTAGSGSKKMAVTSLALGILGFLTGFIGIGILLGLVAVILGVMALVKHQASKGLAIGGIVTGGLALLLGPIAFLAFLTTVAGIEALNNSTSNESFHSEYEN